MAHGAAAAAAAEPQQQRRKRKPGGAGEAASKKARGGAGAAGAAAASHGKLGKGTASLINKWQKVAQQVRVRLHSGCAVAPLLVAWLAESRS